MSTLITMETEITLKVFLRFTPPHTEPATRDYPGCEDPLELVNIKIGEGRNSVVFDPTVCLSGDDCDELISNAEAYIEVLKEG